MLKLEILDDERQKLDIISELKEDSIKYANDIADSGELFEAGEFLHSAAEVFEAIIKTEQHEFFRIIIKFWENQIGSYKLQGKLHEIAEIYLRIADLEERSHNLKSAKKNIINSINFLKQESKILREFNDSRKLAQNYQNIAELFLKISDFKNARKYYSDVINIGKENHLLDLLSYSYQQLASCYQELDDITKSKESLLDGIEFFSNLIPIFEQKNDYLTISQISQVLKNMYRIIDDEEQFMFYSKKEAGAFISLAERLEKKVDNFQKIARYYRGAALCYQDLANNLIESASCFVLAGNYSEKIEDFDEAGVNFYNAAVTFKDLSNLEMSFRYYVKAGDNNWKIENVNDSTECYLTAYDIAVEGGFEFDKFGIFNQIIRGLNKIAKEGLKNKQFYIAATLILESIKFYQQLETAKDFLVNEMVNNVYKYYYKAANLKKIGPSHIVQSYVLAALSSILNGKIEKASEIISEIESEGKTVKKFKDLIRIIIEWVKEGKIVEFKNIPFELQRIISGSEEIMYLLRLFKGYQIVV